MKTNQIYKIFGTDYKLLTKKILNKSNLISHIGDKNKKICIKPNLVVPTPAIMGATTHSEVVEGIIEYLNENGFYNIFIAESCWIGESTNECFIETGFKKLCDKYNIPFYDIKKMASRNIDCAGMILKVSDIVDKIDYMIDVPVLKGHCQLKMTCALKNMKGLVPDDEKRRFHSIGINNPIGHLCAGVHVDFVVVDNICGDVNFEEGGNPITRNCIMTGLDPVLIDTYACKLFDIPIDDIPYIKIANECGVGSTDISNAEIISLNKPSEDIDLSKYINMLDVSYAVEDIDACSKCYANLVPALMKLDEEGLLQKLNAKISIGQKHKGNKGILGVGNCTIGFNKCIKGCPPDKDIIYQELKEYVNEH